MCAPALMTDPAGFHDNYPVCTWQVLQLMCRQNACPVLHKPTYAGVEEV